ncbi:MAG: hypothetical protein M1833_000282 [Piccolia ochrophora]|nr:MAG: hypothetical protein M1833_000282 [Piccolia ochrophora]
MSAAAQRYQQAIHQYKPRGGSSDDPPNPPQAEATTLPATASASEVVPVPSSTAMTDTNMTDIAPQDAAKEQAAPAPAPSQNSTPLPPAQLSQVRTSTPTRATNGLGEPGSRSAISGSEAAPSLPPHSVEHGAPFRRYLNSRVTPSLLAGMKQLGLEQPNDPLRFLGEFLLQKSKELETS